MAQIQLHMKQQLNYNQTAHHSFEENVIGYTINILQKAQTELKNQGVETPFTLEQLQKGNFNELFTSYHEKECKKQNSKFILSKYLDLCGFNNKILLELEDIYKNIIGKEHFFYSLNDLFYKNCELFQIRNTNLEDALKKAPKKKAYKVFDFLTIKNDTCKIEVPKDFYTLYATNENQVNTINYIDAYIIACKNLGLDYNTTLKPIEKYIKNLERDLGKYDLNYDNILLIA